MGEDRRRHSAEFKREAVRLLETSGRKVGEIADELKINAHMLQRWKREYDESPDNCFPGMGRRVSGAEEMDRIHKLEQELENVKMERDILKKAVVIFSKEPK
jgi:transposase